MVNQNLITFFFNKISSYFYHLLGVTMSPTTIGMIDYHSVVNTTAPLTAIVPRQVKNPNSITSFISGRIIGKHFGFSFKKQKLKLK